MNDQLQQKLVEILASIQSAAKATGDFALAQLPDIAQNYVMYGRVKSALLSCLFVGLIVGFAKYGMWAYKNPWFEKWGNRNERKIGNLFAMFGGFVGGFVCLALLLGNIDLLVWVSPKVWLLKELAGLIK